MKKILTLAVGVILLFSAVLAEVSISTPNDIYNLGEKMYVSLDKIKGSEEGNINLDLICENVTVNLLRISARSFSTDGNQFYSLPYKVLTKEDLELDDINRIVGNCYLYYSSNLETSKTPIFEITNKVNLNANLNVLDFLPGATAELAFWVTDANGEAFNGHYLVNNFTNLNGEFTSGKEVSFVIPEDQKADSYKLTVFVYNKGTSGEILNFDEKEISIIVKQKPTKLDLGISKLSINPEENLTITSELLDQTNEQISEEITLYLESPTKETKKYFIPSGEYIQVPFEANASPGTWKVRASFSDMISQEVEFLINPVPKLSYVIDGSFLTIKNIGNALYDDIFKIKIGETEAILDVKLKSNEEKQYRLQAPEGEYDIKIGEEETILGSVFLTGNAVSIKSTDKSKIRNYSLLWLFPIFILGGLVFILVAQKKGLIKYEKKPKKENTKQVKPNFINHITEKRKPKRCKPKKEKEEEKIIDHTQLNKYKVSSTLVLNGEKITSTVVSIHLSNIHSLSQIIKDKLNELLKDVCKDKCIIDFKEDYVFIMLTPLITKTFKNEIAGSKIALEIQKVLNEYNKKFKEKIEFGIGINNADIVIQKNENKINYTSIGEGFSYTKKLSSIQLAKVFISDEIRRKLMRDIKVNKAGELGNKPYFELNEIKNKEINQAKLQELLKRM